MFENKSVDNIGLKLREYFIANKSKQLGRSYRPSPKLDTKENWSKAAIKCLALDASAKDFVEAIFLYNVGKDHGGPYINHLYSKAADFAYKKFAEDGNLAERQGDELAEEINSARDQITSAMRFRSMTAEEFLLSDITPIRAIVRLFLQPNSKRLWVKFCDKAKVELLNDPPLEAKLKEIKFNLNKLYEFHRYD